MSARNRAESWVTSARSVRPTFAGSRITYNEPVHGKRTTSATYARSRKALRGIAQTLDASFRLLFGAGPYDDHHGGGLWVVDETGWFLLRNLAGIEWAAQFCADPKKVDLLRINARRLYAAFPRSFDAFAALGIDLRALLDTPITSAALVAQWTDSICNASVPLPPAIHTGSLPSGAGVHVYPTPVTDIDRIRANDFELWVHDEHGNVAAVVPVSSRRSPSRGVYVVHASPGTALHRAHRAAQSRGEWLQLAASHPIAKAALARPRRAA